MGVGLFGHVGQKVVKGFLPKLVCRVSAYTGTFSKAVRLNQSSEYQQVFRSRCYSVDRCFRVMAKPNSIGYARLGIAVAKKKIKRAVCRNRIKRIIRESFRYHQGALNNVDVVVVVNKENGTSSNKQLVASLDRHWEKIILQCRHY